MGRLDGKSADQRASPGPGATEGRMCPRGPRWCWHVLDDEGKKVEARFRANGASDLRAPGRHARADWRAAVATAVEATESERARTTNGHILFRGDRGHRAMDRIMGQSQRVFLARSPSRQMRRRGGSISTSSGGWYGAPRNRAYSRRKVRCASSPVTAIQHAKDKIVPTRAFRADATT